ncbi:MAG: PilT/PilU family type 4a pilus ATPase [Phycisphaerales bacterium]|nr:PilT/PilU family type 4a pilus ATPase [Phycisphaerales bacterium]
MPVVNGFIFDLLRGMVTRGASDLHLVPGYAPVYRIHGSLHPVADSPLDVAGTRDMIVTALPEPHRTHAADRKNIDCAVSLDDAREHLRFRANVFYAQGRMCACFRHIPNKIPDFEWMGFPTALAERITQTRNGLVIITGVTGSGKTTTLAALINQLIRSGRHRVITVEQPVEYVFEPAAGSVVTQREVGVDVESFHDGLVYGLRQDPNVVLVGEIRDRQTAQMALSAAETGHLILSTLHTQDAKGAITRLVDLFPHDAQDDVRSQLSLSLRYVICQHLLPPANDGDKRALAVESLIVNHAVRAAIRFGKIESIENAIQTGRKEGMTTLDESIAALASAGRITWETARHYAKDPSGVADYAAPARPR